MNEENKSGLRVNSRFLMVIFGLMAIAGIVTIIFFFRINSLTNKKVAETAEAKRPANLDLIAITDDSCKDCFNLNLVFDYIKKENVTFNSQKTLDKSSEEGKQLIEKFAIQKLPTFVLTGELNKNPVLSEFFSKTGETIDNTFVFRQVGNPYAAADTGAVKGRVGLTLLTDITCTECYDVTQHEIILKNNFGINTTANVIDTKSAAGQALVRKYNIKLVPTLILSGDTKEYAGLETVWKDVGIIAADGAYVFTTGVPLMGTYKDLSTNKIITPVAETAPQE